MLDAPLRRDQVELLQHVRRFAEQVANPPTIAGSTSTAPAMAACHQFIDEVCNAQVRCDPTVMSATCQAQTAAQIDCTKMIGVKLTFEQCISDLKTIACTATTAPASCSGALLQTM